MDWSGPVSVDNDHTVTVPEFTELVNTSLVEEAVHRQLRNVQGSDIMRYIIARSVCRSLL